MTQTRARSNEAKEKQIKRIINEARDLFGEVGTSGFSMRALAKRLEMSQGNLYNYWSSKRELWYTIMEHDFSELESDMKELLETHKGSFLDLLEKLADFYFDFASSNPRRYQLMFIIPPPPADDKSQYEIEFEPQSINVLLNIIEIGVAKGDLKEVDAKKLALYLWSVIHGAVLVCNTIIFDPRYKISSFGSKEDFQEYVKTTLKQLLLMYIKEE